MTMDPADLTALNAFDDRAVRRAARRGVLRVGLAAAAALLALVVLAMAATVSAGFVRGDGFFRIAYQGTVVAHPEYELRQDGSCCAAGPLMGLTNLGLASELHLTAQPTGALSFGGTSTVDVTQDAFGLIEVHAGNVPTPLLQALQRDRPDPALVQQFLRDLPAPTSVSALIEFTQPVSEAALQAFFDANVPIPAVPDRRIPVILVNPYGSADHNLLGWPNAHLGEFRAWVADLRDGDDELLTHMNLPPAARLREIADSGVVHAFIARGLPSPVLRALSADPAVRSVNVLDVAFDPGAQYPR